MGHLHSSSIFAGGPATLIFPSWKSVRTFRSRYSVIHFCLSGTSFIDDEPVFAYSVCFVSFIVLFKFLANISIASLKLNTVSRYFCDYCVYNYFVECRKWKYFS